MNENFIKVSNFLKSKNVKNNDFMLKTINKELTDDFVIDYLNNTDVNDKELNYKIIKECENNIWFFMRNVVRVSVNGDMKLLQLTLNTCAMIYCYDNSINTYTLSPRQTFKDITAICIIIYHNLFKNKNYIFNERHKSNYYKINEIIKISKLDKLLNINSTKIYEDTDTLLYVNNEIEFDNNIKIDELLKSNNLLMLHGVINKNLFEDNFDLYGFSTNLKLFNSKLYDNPEKINKNEMIKIQYPILDIVTDEFIEYGFKLLNKDIEVFMSEILLCR